MKQIGVEGFSCSCCGKTLQKDDFVEACSDCGALFCKECSDNGELAHHDCLE